MTGPQIRAPLPRVSFLNDEDAMLLTHRSPPLYRILKRAAYACVKPIYLAKSEDGFLRTGYFLFGIQLATLLLFLKVSNPFGIWHLISQKTPHLLGIVLWSIGKENPPVWGANSFADLTILYICGALVAPIRRSLGGFGAASAMWLVGKMISVGESLVQRRTLALFCTIGLLVSFTLGLTALYYNYKERSQQRYAYKNWLTETERFLERATLAFQERPLFATVEKTWSDIFEDALPLRKDHPALILQETLDHLYATPAEDLELWIYALREEARRLSRLGVIKDAVRAPPTDNIREWSILFAFLGRAHMRIIGDSCGPDEDLVDSLKYYRAVTSEEARRSRLNGLGTVFACRVALYLRALEAGQQADVPEWETPSCSSLRDCLEEAIENYDAAAEGSETCGFLDKRLRNNILDLYLKIGRHFKLASRYLNAPPFDRQVATPSAFAATLEDQIHQLTACSRRGEFVPATFLSSAQAFGVMADVLGPSSANRDSVLAGAANYLNLSFAWLPGTTSESDFSYFCAALDIDNRLSDTFLSSFRATLPGVERYPESELERKIQQTCGALNE